MAAACVFLLNLPKDIYAANTQPMLSHINVGTGRDVSIADLAQTIAQVTGFEGRISFDATKPDGTPRKLLDVSRLTNMGWKACVPLEEGVRHTYGWFLANQDTLRTA
jgi:nucleoside-diphosphate-sugar epimerase